MTVLTTKTPSTTTNPHTTSIRSLVNIEKHQIKLILSREQIQSRNNDLRQLGHKELLNLRSLLEVRP